MRKISNTDPINLLKDPRVIFQYKEFRLDINDNDYFFWLRDGDYLIWAVAGLGASYEGRPRKWVGGNQLEIPKEGLFWLIKVIEEKFFKTEAEGGLAKGQFGYEEVVNGEKLVVSRMFGTPGYSFRNHSRYSHLWDGSTDPQEAMFTDEMLFEKGMFDEFKKLAEKIEKAII
jgi:putative sterol carrier protein